MAACPRCDGFASDEALSLEGETWTAVAHCLNCGWIGGEPIRSWIFIMRFLFHRRLITSSRRSMILNIGG